MKERLKTCCNRITGAIRQHPTYYILALLTVVASGLFVAIMMTRTLPFAEGWYTYYSKCINSGLMPYTDFEYLYSPVYIYFTALVTRIFGYDLMVLRSLGIIFFSLIALGIYMSVCVIVGKKRAWIAFVASLTAVFYLQTEVVQVFYDYVRLMDACAAFSLYFLLKSIKAIINKEPRTGSLVALGIFLALFANIKQNTGLIFSVYAIILLIYVSIWAGTKIKEMLRDLLVVLIPIVSITLVIYGAMLISGSLSAYLSMTGLAAASAKGGMMAILFGWLINNKSAFINALPIGLAGIVLIVGLYFLRRRCKRDTDDNNTNKEPDFLLGYAFAALLLVGLFVLKFSRGFTEWITPTRFLSPYGIFLTVAPIFVACGIWGIVDIVRKKKTMAESMLLFSLAGAYFAIAFACGNSGGIAEGQSAFGIAFIVTSILLFLDYAELRIIRVAAVVLCLVSVLQFAGKKMLWTYNWWGMDESDYWESTETLDLPLLGGIRVSAETKQVYETIVRHITENTDPDDPIFCFPQIPLFYNLCDRNDPGTFTKVQWFDVATDASVLSDIEVLKNNPPQAIVIYNTSDGAYSAHESSFRNGNESGTRVMREFLYNYVSDNGYKFYGRFVANNNSISLWIADDSAQTPAVNFARGSGTADDPYVISTPAQMKYFSDMVSAGRTFDGQYIRQEGNIDMSAYGEFTPIGSTEDGTYFAGTYDGNGYCITGIIPAEDITAEDTVRFSFFGTDHGDGYDVIFKSWLDITLFPVTEGE